MPNREFIQIYKGNQGLYADLLPRWIDFIRELDAHRNSATTDNEIILALDRRVNIQGSRKDMHFELMYCGGDLIGFANFAIDLGTIYGLLEAGYGAFLGFYIAPAFRRKGYGRRLFEHAEETLKSDGARQMHVCPDSVTGAPFWIAMGFRDSGKFDPDDKLPIYIKRISAGEE